MDRIMQFGRCAITGPTEFIVDEYGRTVSIDIEHMEIHRGNFYVASVRDPSVDTAAPKRMTLTAPAGIELHTRFDFFAGPSGGVFNLSESPTVTVPGLAVVPKNRNRNSTKTSSAVVKEDPTITAVGTFLESADVGAAGGTSRAGGESQWRDEFIVKPGTTILIEFIPTANSTLVNMKALYYEVPA